MRTRPRRKVLAGVAGLVGAAAALVPAAGALAAPSGPGPAPNGAVAGTASVLLAGSTTLGPAPAGRPARVTLALPLRDQAGLMAAVGAMYDPSSPRYRHFLTPGQFAAAYSPTPGQLGSVTSWAASSGLAVTSVSPNRTLVEVAGTAASLGRALGTTLERFRAPDGSTYVSTPASAVLPGALAGQVDAVVGLSELDRAALSPATVDGVGHALLGLGAPSSYGPAQLAALYHAPASAQGAGQTVGVLAEGRLTQVGADLGAFETTNHLPRVPVSVVPVGGPSKDTSGQAEFDLDTQYARALAPQLAGLVVYDAHSENDQDIAAEINRFVTDDRVKEASFSAGECEALAQASGFQAATDTALLQAVAQGQTLFVSSGDGGYSCPTLLSVDGLSVGLPGLSYPASSPYAVAVGGTTVLGGPGPLAEIAWPGSGGGLSLLEPEPAYQAHVGGSNLGLRRGVPDVALDADPATGYRVVVSGHTVVIGGTSASAPAWLGIWARAQGAHGSNLGFANGVIYREPASAFRDIVLGTNGVFLATPGWDYVTGRGTPDIAAFVAAAGGA